MLSKLLNNINQGLLYLEKRCGTYFSALIVSLILLCIAVVYVTPAFTPMQLGRGYASLSVSPFDFSEQNNLRYRILSPFLAYCIGLRGVLYIIFPLAISWLFLAVLYNYLRKAQDALVSLFITMFICFSTPILFLLHFAGYVDITSYFLILLIIIYIKKPVLWIVLLALLLLNHDSNLFILPAVLFVRYLQVAGQPRAFMKIIVGLGIALIPFYLYRRYIDHVSPVDYNADMYISQITDNIKSIAAYFPIGFFYAFKLFWVFPLLAIYYYWKQKDRQQLVLFALILMGALGQLLLASDTSRLIGLAFPMVIVAAVKVKEQWGTERFLKFSFYLILLNFLIPHYYVGQSVMIRFYPWPSSLILKYFYGIETFVG
jgi:hypothetical protein